MTRATKDSPKKKLPVIIPVLCIVLVGIIGICVPQAIALFKRGAAVRDLKKKITEMERGIDSVAEIKAQAVDAQAKYDVLMGRLLPQREYGVFLETLSQLANKSGVKIVAMEPQAFIDAPENFYLKLPIFIDAHCGYHQLGEFLAEIERSPHWMSVEMLKIDGGTGEGTGPVLTVFIRIGALCQREQTDAK